MLAIIIMIRLLILFHLKGKGNSNRKKTAQKRANASFTRLSCTMLDLSVHTVGTPMLWSFCLQCCSPASSPLIHSLAQVRHQAFYPETFSNLTWGEVLWALPLVLNHPSFHAVVNIYIRMGAPESALLTHSALLVEGSMGELRHLYRE